MVIMREVCQWSKLKNIVKSKITNISAQKMEIYKNLYKKY